MAFQTITLDMPEPVYRRLKRAAEALQRPVMDIIVETLSSALPSLDDVPPDTVDDLARMGALPHEALWEIARSVMPARQQDRLRTLSVTQQERQLTPGEIQKLHELRREYGKVTLCKAQAYALLRKRGLHTPINS